MKKILNKKMILLLSMLLGIGFLFGLVFIFFLNDLDKFVIKEGLIEYITSISEKTILYKEGLINSIKTNMIYLFIIWISSIIFVIIPLIFFTLFYKGFTLGFMLSSFIYSYKAKGFLVSLLFIFPHEILNVLILSLFSIYALKFSRKLMKAIYKNENVNLRKLLKNYLIIFIIFIVISIISSLLEIYLNSILIRLFI